MTVEMAPEFFVGREEKLALIGDLLAAPWGSRRVLLVHGLGGVGKTRLLQEIYRRREEYTRTLGDAFLFTNVFDFDEVSLRLALNWEQRLVEELGQGWFREYLTARDTYIRFELLGADPDLLREQRRRKDRFFIESYNRLAKEKRILLLFDTLETVQGTELWRHLLDIADGLENTVMVLAGRKLDEVRPELENRWNTEVVHFIELQPFSESEVADYFASTDVGAEVEPEMREKLYLLTGGHPILIALAIEWLRRDMPINDITARPLAELKAFSKEELARRREKFEAILVNKILELTPIDQAILRMAHVYLRFDDRILKYLLWLSDKETASLSHELRAFPFVKPRPQGA